MLAAAPAPIQVAVLAFDSCMTSAVVGILDVLQIANQWSAQSSDGSAVKFAACVLAEAQVVTGTAGFVIPAEPLDDTRHIDLAIVPPIFGPVAETLAANTAITASLQRRSHKGAIVASVCAGAFFLAAAGLLVGRRATTNPLLAAAFRQAYPETTLLLDRRVVDEGRVLSAGSTSAFLDLTVYLVDRFAGHAIAVATAKSLSIDKNHRSQLPHFLQFAGRDHGDAAVLALQTWMEAHVASPTTAAQLARRGAMSQRSLNRRFLSATALTPIEYLHRLRIESAKQLLETSDLNIDEITERVGYRDGRSFSRLFRSIAGLSPREYRARFGSGSADPGTA